MHFPPPPRSTRHRSSRRRGAHVNYAASAVAEDFTAHLGDATLTQLPADGRGDERPCYHDPVDPRTDEDGFSCATTHPTRRTLEIDYRPRRGVLAPVDAGLVTRVAFPSASLGGALVVYSGIHDYYSRKNADAPVHFEVFVDGQRVMAVDQGNQGWGRHDLLTPVGAHEVRFEIRASQAAWRTFGFHAESRSRSPGAPRS